MAKRVRSPAYPVFDLEEAIEKTRLLYVAEATAFAAVDVACEAWGYSPDSSSGPQAIASLKQYGLIEETGRGADRLIKVSSLTLDILEPERHTNQLEAIRVAALTPPIFRELWQQFGTGGSDTNIRASLVRRGFNSKAIPTIIRSYRGTEKFASLGDGPKIALESESQTPLDRSRQLPSAAPESSYGSTQTRFSAPHGKLDLPILLNDGSVCIVSIPKMDQQAFEFFKAQLDVYQRGIVIDDPSSSSGSSESSESSSSSSSEED